MDLTNVGADDLDALYRACKQAEFGQSGENVFDESYRKARKMDLTCFATLLDPRSLGIHDQVAKALLTQSFAMMDIELYKLNVYGERSHQWVSCSFRVQPHCFVGKGDFFKAHKDTPRSQDMFGSLVVVLPTVHEGCQLVLRHGEREWTIDFTETFATATEASVCFVALFSDVEHEVLPVTSGYRVTLTYNLFRKPMHPTTTILTPFHFQLKQTLVDLVNDKSKLPNGGYLGFGLAHEYVHTGRNVLDSLLGQLKGSDCTLADVCNELGLRYSLRLLYREITEPMLNFITTKELDVGEGTYEVTELVPDLYLRKSLKRLSIEQVEGVILVGLGGRRKFDPRILGDDDHYGYYSPWLRSFYRTPITEVLEITPMKSSVDVKTSPFIVYGNEAEVEHFYGTACMLIAVEPETSRNLVGM
jgi:hypothetical protein